MISEPLLDMMTLTDVAAEANISNVTLRRLLNSDRGPASHFRGRRRFVLRRDFDAWVATLAAAGW